MVLLYGLLTGCGAAVEGRRAHWLQDEAVALKGHEDCSEAALLAGALHAQTPATGFDCISCSAQDTLEFAGAIKEFASGIPYEHAFNCDRRRG